MEMVNLQDVENKKNFNVEDSREFSLEVVEGYNEPKWVDLQILYFFRVITGQPNWPWNLNINLVQAQI